MRVAVVSGWDGEGILADLADDASPIGEPQPVRDVAAAVREREASGDPRWIWADTAQIYPRLLEAGVGVRRCHDVALTEAILLGHEGRWGQPRSLAAAWARLRGLPVPDDPPSLPRDNQPALFEPDRTGLPEGADPMAALLAVYTAQLSRIGAAEHPDRMRLLVAAESAGALAAAEMGEHGLPWRVDVHEELLTELLGPRPPPGTLPVVLRALADQIAEAFGGRRVNPDSPAEVVRAFAREGIELPSARSFVLKEVQHPAAPIMLRYKELSRLHAAHGWAWLEAWVRGGRFRPEYVAGGVVSGRWATRGGGALQIPRAVRRAVVADPGWALVVADAQQLEPRVLAALADDRDMAEAASAVDLYAELAAQAFGSDRAKAKIGLLSAMYGGGDPAALAALRRRFPRAVDHVEAAARAGEEGAIVRSRLGRTSPPPSQRWWDAVNGPDRRRAGQVARDRSRFTRNFVVQASASDWALVLLAELRRRIAGLGVDRAHMVFFMHDEVVVHAARSVADQVVGAVSEAARTAGTLVFGDTPVRFPLKVGVVENYADAK